MGEGYKPLASSLQTLGPEVITDIALAAELLTVLAPGSFLTVLALHERGANAKVPLVHIAFYCIPLNSLPRSHG
jgi:hypothetical protein